jgi:hypothetical protein
MDARAKAPGPLFVLALLVLLAWPPSTEAAFVRANCRGIQEFSTTEARVSCQESSALSDEAEHLMLGHTRASASLAEARLSTSAAGGQIRDVGWNGGEAGALLMDRLTIVGDWAGDRAVDRDGHVAVTVHLCVAYRFAGFGESRIDATLRTSSAGNATGDNQARVRLRHRGFGGTALTDFESRGEFTIPEEGPRAAQAVFELTVTERVHYSSPQMNLRADVAVFALPNLEPLEPVLSSFGQSVALIAVSLPGRFAFSSESGVFLSESGTVGNMGLKPGPRRSWVIMKTTSIGKWNALRSHRDWYRIAARSDCRHQFGVDG